MAIETGTNAYYLSAFSMRSKRIELFKELDSLNMKQHPFMKSFFKSFAQLLFPQQCLLCLEPIDQKQQTVCHTCMIDLPRTGFHRIPENPLEKSLWGRIDFERVFAFLLYQKGNITQQAIHAIKYQNEKQLGVLLTKMFVKEVFKELSFTADYIVPVPLHPAKLQQRGYNQAAIIAAAMAEEIDIPLSTNFLIRSTHKKSQTTRNRFDRWMNMSSVFDVENIDEYFDKHILLVDDVITTGATLEACCEVLKPIVGKVSIAALAFTYS